MPVQLVVTLLPELLRVNVLVGDCEPAMTVTLLGSKPVFIEIAKDAALLPELRPIPP